VLIVRDSPANAYQQTGERVTKQTETTKSVTEPKKRL
jgi:hypothetical protein